MLLTYFASHPAAPAGLIDHLLAYCLARPVTTWQDRELRAALAANPATPLDRVPQLLALPLHEGRALILKGALQRPGMTGADVITLLGEDTSAGSLSAALSAITDPSGDLARHAYAHGTGTQVWTALAASAATPPAVRYAAALDLATCKKKLAEKARSAIRSAVKHRFAHARTRAEHTAAKDWALDLVARTPDVKVKQVASLIRSHSPAPFGSQRWLKSPLTPAGDIAAWAAEVGTVVAWSAALVAADDPTGQLALAAQAAHPHSPVIARQVVRSAAPIRARQRALPVAARRPLESERHGPHSGGLMLTGDHNFVLAFVQNYPNRFDLAEAAQRLDLTSGDLDALTAMRHKVTGPVAGTPLMKAYWGVFLATHEASTPAQRAYGLRLSAEWDADPAGTTAFRRNLSEAAGRIAALALDLEPNDPAGQARVGRRLPLKVVTHGGLARVPTVQRLLFAAVAQELGAAFTPEAARALTALVDTSFTGTLGELFDTTQAIAG